MAATMEHFIYTPLDATKKQIRVVQVHSFVKKTGLVSCKLKTIDLVDNGHSALSYTWGEPGPTHTILLNGCRLEVRQNLHDFLLRACKPKISDWMFIDAICINQENADERGRLVRMMGEIYRLAERVVVFPGRTHPGTARPNMLLRCISRVYIDHERYPWALRLPLQYWSFWQMCSQAARERFVLQIWNEPYWERLWIVQELVLAKSITIVVGKTTISWAFWHHIRDPRHSQSPKFKPLPMEKDALRRSKICDSMFQLRALQLTENDHSIETVVTRTCDGRHRERNDRIYALLGMMPTTFETFLVDYRRPWEQVVADFVERLFEHSTARLHSAIGVLRGLNSFPEMLCRTCFEGPVATSSTATNSVQNGGQTGAVAQQKSFWIFSAPLKTSNEFFELGPDCLDPVSDPPMNLSCFRCRTILVRRYNRVLPDTLKRVSDNILMLEPFDT